MIVERIVDRREIDKGMTFHTACHGSVFQDAEDDGNYESAGHVEYWDRNSKGAKYVNGPDLRLYGTGTRRSSRLQKTSNRN